MWQTSMCRRTHWGRRTALAGVAVLAVLGASATALAGPWNRNLGSAYLKVGFSYYQADQSFSRGVATGLDYEAWTYNLFAEIGLPSRFSLVMDVPYVVARNGSSAGFVYGNNTFGDGRFELDFQLLPTIPLSLGVETKVPLYHSVSSHASDSLIDVNGRPYPSDNFPDVGDSNVDITPKLLAGWSFAPLFPGWVTAELGYRIRTDGFADGVAGAFGFGSYVWPEHIALGFYMNGNVNVQTDPNPAEQASTELLYVQGYMLVTAAPWVPNLGLTFSVGGIVSAVNSGEGMDYGLGLSYDL